MRFLSRLKLSQWTLLLFVIPLLVQLSSIVILTGQIEKAEEERNREESDKQKKAHLGKILRLIMTNASGSTMYVISPDIRPTVLDRTRKTSQLISQEFNELEKLSAGNEAESEQIAHIRKLSNVIFQNFSSVKEQIDSRNLVDTLGQLREMKKNIITIDNEIEDLVTMQEKYEESHPDNFSHRRELVKQLLLLATAINIIISGVLALYFYRSMTRRLSVVVDNSYRLASNVPLHPAVEGTDEIAQLDKVFRAMARSLEEMARKESAVIENAQDVICSIDERGSITKISAASLPLFGYEPDHLLGRNFRSMIYKDDGDQSFSSLQLIHDGESSAPFESRVQRKDGTIIYVLWSAHWSPSEKSFFCVGHDITERKRAENLLREAEARIRLIVQSMPIGLVIIDAQGTIELINPCIEQMFGKAVEKGTNLAALLGKQETESEQEFVLRLIDKTKERSLEMESDAANQKTLPIEVSVNEFETLEGQRLLVLITDVTERHEVERLKQEFISMVSHELRSPLNSVLGFLDNLPMGIYGELNEKGQDKVRVAERSITRLIKLINDLLDLDKMETRGLTMDFQDVQVQPVLQRSIDAVRSLAEQAEINFELDTTDATIYADEDRLVQVVVNLLSNAIKFSPHGSAVQISVKPQDDWVEVRVSDHGRGIPEQHKNRVFERFQQVASTDWKEKGGSGLGLPISRAIIEQHNGSIGVDSEEGKGSQFWFRLPVKPPLRIEQAEPMASAS